MDATRAAESAVSAPMSAAGASVHSSNDSHRQYRHHQRSSHRTSLLGRLLGWNRVRPLSSSDVNPSVKSRVLYVNEVRRSQDYAEQMHKTHAAHLYHGNIVRTSKYTLLSFVPKSLFEQFRRVANFYFLIISLLQLCTDLSPTNEYSTIGPLMIVFLATMIKEGLEDRARHYEDHLVNHQRVDVFCEPTPSDQSDTAAQSSADSSKPTYQSVFWKQLRVGHVIKIHENDLVPADMVLLFSSHEDAEVMCETSSLDGESNLKVRHCIKWNQIIPRTANDFGTSLRGEIRCELPNKRLYSFDGVLQLSFTSDAAKSEAQEAMELRRRTFFMAASGRSMNSFGLAQMPESEEIPISIENVMLRGMKLCNTKWAIGVIVGAGNDSKLIQNMKAIPSKFSRLDRVANRCIFLIFAVLFAVCCISSVQAALFSNKVHSRPSHASAMPYIKRFRPAEYVEVWVTYLILYNNMVPISLYISLEVVKWYQARRIESDPRLRCSDNGLGVTARTSNVNEDLGQIKYIFSDKTGTLTRNQMLFKVCSIGGIIFDGSNMNLRRLAKAVGGGSILEDTSFLNGSMSGSMHTPTPAPAPATLHKDGHPGVARSGSHSSGRGSGSSTDGRRAVRHGPLSEKDVRPFHQLPMMMENPSKFVGKEQHSLELARPFFRCLLLCHSASVVMEEATSSTPRSGVTTSGMASTASSERMSNASALGPLPGFDSASLRDLLKPEGGNNTTGHRRPSMASQFKYFGSSPDEVALLNAAVEFQCAFEERDRDLIHIRIFGERETYRVLALNEFDSVRKCMSVVVQRIAVEGAKTPKQKRATRKSPFPNLPDDEDNAASDAEDNAKGAKEENDTAQDNGEDIEEEEEDDVLQNEDDILVFCKGADTIMFANAANAQDISKLGLHVHYFAAMALRTLLLGYRSLTKAEYFAWKTEYDIARRSLSDREHLCLQVAKQIETSIYLLGATGVEDLLQDGVRECIDQLVQAGVNVWMLTGDKDETAISVAHMCGLIGEKSKIVIIKGKNRQDCLDEIANARRKLKREGVWIPGVASRNISLVINGEALEHLLTDAPYKRLDQHIHMGAANQVVPSAGTVDMFGDEVSTAVPSLLHDSQTTKSAGSIPIAGLALPTTNSSSNNIVAIGTSVPGANTSSSGLYNRRVGSRHISTRPSVADYLNSAQQAQELFMELATQCSSVVACRLSPMQKAQVVGLMKYAPGEPLTLAVGDGGNDVSMIQEAHVGVGIHGHEGMQAVRAADFAIATFRHLSRLLLVHGRWNHRRVALVILFSFYKNTALIMTLFAYSQRNAYSGQTLYESYLMVGWNVFYTILPIFVLGIADEDIRDRTVLQYPFVYRSALKQSELSIKKLSYWVLNALLHSQLIFFFTMGTLNGTPSSVLGYSNGLFTDGTAVYGALVIVVTLRASLSMQRFHRWTRAHYMSLFGGFAAFLVFVIAYSHALQLLPTFDVFRDFYAIGNVLFSEAAYWVLIFFTSIACIAPDFATAYLKQMYLPSSTDIIQEIDSGLGEHFDFSSIEDARVLSAGGNSGTTSSRSMKLPDASSARSDDVNTNGSAPTTPTGSSTGSTRTDLTSSLLDGEWSQKFRDFDRPTEHDELSKQLSALQREIAQEIGLPDPMFGEDEAHSSRALNVQPSVHPLTLEFMGEEHQQVEGEYALAFAFRERARVILCLKILIFVIPLYALYEYFWEGEASYVWIRVGYFCCVLAYMRVVRTKAFIEFYQPAILVPVCVIGMALTLTISDSGKFAAALYPIVLLVVIRVEFLYALVLSIYNYSFYLLAGKIGLMEESAASQDIPDMLLFSLYVVFVIVFGALSCYSLQITMRRDFLQSRSLLLEQKRSTQILKNMLPEHVVKRMQKGETLISEDEKDVTILFCDIADFASFVTRFSPTEVVSLLDRVYSLFDQMCQKHGVRKMETVGKTYMACAGLQGKDRGKEAALRAVSMAIDMLNTLERCRASNGNGIKLRIGVHSGRVISGLVGMKKQQFSLFGDTVNTASRMQSTGITGRCQISHVTYRKLVGHFTFEERQIQVKGKGTMTTYMLGEPLTDLARMAVGGQLEHIIKRESLIVSDSVTKKTFDPDFLSATRQRWLLNVKKQWARYDILRLLVGSPPNSLQDFGTPSSNLGAMSGVEVDMLSEIHSLQLRFKENEMEYKFLETTLSDRVEGARSTLIALALYAIFAALRDLTIELVQTRTKIHGKVYHVNSSTYVVILVTRFFYAVFAVMLARHARQEFPDYSEVRLRNVLLGAYMFGLCCFTVPEVMLWRLNYELLVDASSRYVHLCLDTVLVMFCTSNGGSILHRHAMMFNIAVIGVVTFATLVCLQVYRQGPEDKDTVQGYNVRFKTGYPIVLTYLSVLTNIVASYGNEFFTRRQIWLKTRTQIETMNADRLLYQMLPAAVVMRLKEGETVCDQHHQVGILFSDIKGFTSIASEANPAQVVNILASLFCAFDKLTEKHGVFKMQTIGDAYVIVSGLPYVDMSLGPILGNATASGTVNQVSSGARMTGNRVLPVASAELMAMTSDRPIGVLARRSTLKHKFQMHIRSHIRDLLAMARDMHMEVRKVSDPNTGERLQMRIGIHIGNIIGGVIGTTTLRYDMWGPDALTANELESNGVPEHTLVSPVVMDVVKGMPDIKCTFHKRTNFTNVPMMDTYLVEFVEPPEVEPSATIAGSMAHAYPLGSLNSLDVVPGATDSAPTTSSGSALKALIAQGSTRTLQLLSNANPRRSMSPGTPPPVDPSGLASILSRGESNRTLAAIRDE
ncbi:hypothetical protein Poli38472_009524 [Pythium oligandrum]|uniref:Guanylate cyclase domain-containing protein n=1 Tax=Pythium oligandrum TaxID=41045 RepID=A0A8K1CEN0_PYTOL|nr:hypothetical protein Poli38472_009524 [Pythium oligandrum]|eukprot:TMW62031.1 hypothetical protein Poli38472_009524 [Pythium oligandrum]